MRLDLGKIDAPVYFILTLDDRIAPWRIIISCTELIKGSLRFVFAAGGRIAGIISHRAENKRN